MNLSSLPQPALQFGIKKPKFTKPTLADIRKVKPETLVKVGDQALKVAKMLGLATPERLDKAVQFVDGLDAQALLAQAAEQATTRLGPETVAQIKTVAAGDSKPLEAGLENAAKRAENIVTAIVENAGPTAGKCATVAATKGMQFLQMLASIAAQASLFAPVAAVKAREAARSLEEGVASGLAAKQKELDNEKDFAERLKAALPKITDFASECIDAGESAFTTDNPAIRLQQLQAKKMLGGGLTQDEEQEIKQIISRLSGQ